MLKRKMILLLFVLMIQPLLKSEFLKKFNDLDNPHCLHIADSRIYIAQESNVFVYDLKSLKILFKFGKKGQGPGELMKSAFYRNKVSTVNNGILFEGYNKIIFFDKKGNLLWEKRKLPVINQSIPVNNNKFVVRKTVGEGGKKQTRECILILNKKLELEKELFCIDCLQHMMGNKMRLNMLLDIPVFKVWKDKIFVEKSINGFLIDVYNYDGKLLYSIKHPYKNLKFTNEHKKKIIDRFSKDVAIKKEGGWKQFSKQNDLIYPETFPAIKNFDIFDNKIYVQTYTEKEGKNEYWILDLKGKLLKKTFLPSFDTDSLLDSILGTKLNCIYQNTLYFIEENDNEDWELHSSFIK